MKSSSITIAVATAGGARLKFRMPRAPTRKKGSRLMPHTGFKRFRPNDTAELKESRDAHVRELLEQEAHDYVEETGVPFAPVGL